MTEQTETRTAAAPATEPQDWAAPGYQIVETSLEVTGYAFTQR
ncbi:pyrroloquinoline quinone precursor peptide PqqA [Kitasatospora viridis]|uniref:Coenzyme PQQ peptide PqqA n=1 Tax=Kitasatospora viridis TaxID=281105 RepID=A0A561UCH3_9ACTN|nr:pyrroloquinoline quinone precursor peptide PqqA [Kitasatospora viridis]TWF97050.1 coenzyme PQQ precursor peptide PqqA [Kitasatospora viridis]